MIVIEETLHIKGTFWEDIPPKDRGIIAKYNPKKIKFRIFYHDEHFTTFWSIGNIQRFPTSSIKDKDMFYQARCVGSGVLDRNFRLSQDIKVKSVRIAWCT